MKTLETGCCIAGGGPAGMMLGFLLARAGVKVVVLEKHKDFLRDFRGDTVHPSTIQLMHELGFLEDFLRLPHQEARQLTAVFNGVPVSLVDFSHLPVVKPFVALIPQWDFLDFIASKAAAYPGFTLIREAKADDLIRTGGRVAGIRATTPDGPLEVRAALVVGCDGRHSAVRSAATLPVLSYDVPIDVLWFKVPKQNGDPVQTFGRFQGGSIMVLLERGEYWQCAYVIPKGGFDGLKSRGIDAFYQEIAAVSPFLAERIHDITDWGEISLLTVTIDRLKKWWEPGLLCIGDAAHAMSPVGGVGINLAVQDAVAAANALYKPLVSGSVVQHDLLAGIQRRREFPVKVIQTIQAVIHRGMVKARKKQTAGLPFVFRVVRALPLLRRIPARLVGMGVRPEHIKTPDVLKN